MFLGLGILFLSQNERVSLWVWKGNLWAKNVGPNKEIFKGFAEPTKGDSSTAVKVLGICFLVTFFILCVTGLAIEGFK